MRVYIENTETPTGKTFFLFRSNERWLFFFVFLRFLFVHILVTLPFVKNRRLAR